MIPFILSAAYCLFALGVAGAAVYVNWNVP